MDPSQEKDQISADPFASDIFADAARPEIVRTETAEAENAVFPWNHQLKKAARPKINWNALRRLLPLDHFGKLPGGLLASLAMLIHSEHAANGDFRLINEREINRREEIPLTNSASWWLTAAIENSSAEIHLEIDDVFAAWLVDAILNEDEAQTTDVRRLTASEAAVLEYAARQLAHDANQILQSPIFKFRQLEQRVPAALETSFAAESPSLLVADWQFTYARQSSIVKIYFSPAALEALQPAGNRLLDSIASRRTEQLRDRTKAENLRLRINLGEAELSHAELGALEKNDVVLLEKLSFFLRNGNLSGRAQVYLGAGENVVIFGDFVAGSFAKPKDIAERGAAGDNKILVRQLNASFPQRISITEISETEMPSPSENFMLEENETAAGESRSPEQMEKGVAIENIGVTLRVELEARHLTLEEAANLRINQVLDLGVAPTEPVNLLINNKIVGRGELVEVENRLGVRIVKLLH